MKNLSNGRRANGQGVGEVGVIAGSMGLGLGRLFAELNADHDGTVMVDETRLPGAKDQVVLSTSHTGMLFSADVARTGGAFPDAWGVQEGGVGGRE